MTQGTWNRSGPAWAGGSSRVVDVHRRLRISAEELDDFRDAFLATLAARLPRRMAAARREEILAAWRDLFAPVVEYFKRAAPEVGTAVSPPRRVPVSMAADRPARPRPAAPRR